MSTTIYCSLCALKGSPRALAHYQVSGWRVCFNHIREVGLPQLVLKEPITEEEAKSIKERFKEAMSWM